MSHERQSSTIRYDCCSFTMSIYCNVYSRLSIIYFLFLILIRRFIIFFILFVLFRSSCRFISLSHQLLFQINVIMTRPIWINSSLSNCSRAGCFHASTHAAGSDWVLYRILNKTQSTIISAKCMVHKHQSNTDTILSVLYLSSYFHSIITKKYTH